MHIESAVTELLLVLTKYLFRWQVSTKTPSSYTNQFRNTSLHSLWGISLYIVPTNDYVITQSDWSHHDPVKTVNDIRSCTLILVAYKYTCQVNPQNLSWIKFLKYQWLFWIVLLSLSDDDIDISYHGFSIEHSLVCRGCHHCWSYYLQFQFQYRWF